MKDFFITIFLLIQARLSSLKSLPHHKGIGMAAIPKINYTANTILLLPVHVQVKWKETEHEFGCVGGGAGHIAPK